MSITMHSATPDSMSEIVEALADWQHTGGPVQLHPGDLGWLERLGPRQLAEAVRVWARDGQVLAVGLTDGPELIRLGLAPSVADDTAFADQVLTGLKVVLPEAGAVEVRFGAALRELLTRDGWMADEPWTPLTRELVDEVEDGGLVIEVLDAHTAPDRVVQDRVDVQRAAFPKSTFTVERWHTMSASSAYRRARCLVGYDPEGNAVAAVTVWSAGPGRPGLLEPMGVHREHRGRGHGRAITLAAAAALREMGSSSATVCTPSSNVGGVATYASAGFVKWPEATDFRRTR